jgi:uncharacterized protein (DUF2236 family)
MTGPRRPEPATLDPMTADSGYFPRGSLLRRVHQERVVGFLYGQRALCIGAANPRNHVAPRSIRAIGKNRSREFARRAKMIETIILGGRKEADSMLARVNEVHERVKETEEQRGVSSTGDQRHIWHRQ